MGFFGFGKKDKVIDLGERYRKTAEGKKENEPSDSFSIFGNSGSSGSDSGDESDQKKKLAKRLLDITNKLDELSTQLYHLQQRVELLERKTGVKAGV